MRTPRAIQIDREQAFETFENAPIVEAIVEFRGPVQSRWEEESVKREFEMRLEHTPYRYLDSFREYAGQFPLNAETPKSPSGEVEYLGWRGLRFKSEDEEHIVQFNRNGFTFSWLGKYKDWELFQNEAMQLWKTYRDVARTESLERIGVRFINKIKFDGSADKAGELVHTSPSAPEGLPIHPIRFFHVDDFAVPGHAYRLRITSTIQPGQLDTANGPSVILDIDVFTTERPDSRDEALHRYLKEMKWLKNMAFLGSVTEAAKALFRGET